MSSFADCFTVLAVSSGRLGLCNSSADGATSKSNESQLKITLQEDSVINDTKFTISASRIVLFNSALLS